MLSEWILQQQIEELQQAQKHNLNKYIRAVQYSEWTTYGGVLEMSAKEETACDLLQCQLWEADVDGIEYSYVTAINHYQWICNSAFNPLKITMFLNQYCLRVWRRRDVILRHH